jgi:hypothetical protein
MGYINNCKNEMKVERFIAHDYRTHERLRRWSVSLRTAMIRYTKKVGQERSMIFSCDNRSSG